MAIDLDSERVITLTDATKLLPRRRKGKKPAVQTLYRWASAGLRGVRLETIQVGGTLCTSAQALQRFFDRLSEQRPSLPNHTSKTYDANVRRAEKQLTKDGI